MNGASMLTKYGLTFVILDLFQSTLKSILSSPRGVSSMKYPRARDLVFDRQLFLTLVDRLQYDHRKHSCPFPT